MKSTLHVVVWCCLIYVIQAIDVQFAPFDHELHEHEEITISGYVSLNDSDDEALASDKLFLKATSVNGLIDISNSSLFVPVGEIGERINFTFGARILEFGHDVFVLQVSSNRSSNATADGRLALRILRKENVLDVIFLAILGIFLVINNINMGSILDMEEVKAVFKKPVGPLVGFGSQFLFMPLASYGVSVWLVDSPNMRFGLFALGSSPGGVGSNFWTYLLHGDLQLSVVMTVVSTLAALGMMPLWLLTLGQRFLEESNVKVPFVQLFIPLGSFILPVAVGILIKKQRPQWAAVIKKIFRPFTVCLLIFLLTVGLYTNLYLFRFLTWRLVLAGLLVAWGGFTFGALAAMAFCMKREQVIAISIETAMQNAGIAFMLLKVSLPQPDADIGCVAPVAQLLVTGPVLWCSLLIYTLVKCVKRRKETDDEAELATYSIGQKLRQWSDRGKVKEVPHETDEKDAKRQENLLNVQHK